MYDFMKAKIHDYAGTVHEIKISSIKNPLTTIDSKFMDGEYLNIFTPSHRVPDVWRYTISVNNNEIKKYKIPRSDDLMNSNYDDRPAADAIGTKIIQLVLESPHTSEYTEHLIPKGPAQGIGVGDAGGAIEHYLHLILNKIKLPDGRFSILVTNPIQYMCSLGFFTQKINTSIRDSVWQAIWNLDPFPQNFVARTAMYQSDYVINCCTQSLQEKVSLTLKNAQLETRLFEAPHPAVQWNISKENTRLIEVL